MIYNCTGRGGGGVEFFGIFSKPNITLVKRILIFTYVFKYLNNYVTIFLEEALERDNFLSPEEAKEFGLIDRVLSHPPNSNDSKPEEEEK